MLHLFNRTVLLSTSSIDKQIKVRDFLLANGYEVYVRMMMHQPMQTAASRMGDSYGKHKADGIYRLYVRRSQYSEIVNHLRENNIL